MKELRCHYKTDSASFLLICLAGLPLCLLILHWFHGLAVQNLLFLLMVVAFLSFVGFAIVVYLVNRGQELILNVVSISIPQGYLKKRPLIVFYKDIRQVKRLGGEEPCLLIRHKHGQLTIAASKLPDEETYEQICEQLLGLVDPEPEPLLAEDRFSYKKSASGLLILGVIVMLFAWAGVDKQGRPFPGFMRGVMTLYVVKVFGESLVIYVRNRRPREIVFGPERFTVPTSYLLDGETTLYYENLLEVKEVLMRGGPRICVMHRDGQLDIATQYLGRGVEGLEQAERLRTKLQSVLAGTRP